MSEREERYVYTRRQSAPREPQPGVNPSQREAIAEARDQIVRAREQLRTQLVEPFLQRRLERLNRALGLLGSLAVQQQPKREEVKLVKCPECGAENPEAARFCNSCGAVLARKPRPKSLSVEV